MKRINEHRVWQHKRRKGIIRVQNLNCAVRQNFSFGLLFSLRADCWLEWHSKCLAFWATNKLLVTDLFVCTVSLVFFKLTMSIVFYQSYSKKWQEAPIKLSIKSYFLKHIKQCIILYEPCNTACSWGTELFESVNGLHDGIMCNLCSFFYSKDIKFGYTRWLQLVLRLHFYWISMSYQKVNVKYSDVIIYFYHFSSLLKVFQPYWIRTQLKFTSFD